MEQAYWLGREHISQVNAWRSRCAIAKLVHLDLAGRYSVKAADAARRHRISFRLDVPLLLAGTSRCPAEHGAAGARRFAEPGGASNAPIILSPVSGAAGSSRTTPYGGAGS